MITSTICTLLGSGLEIRTGLYDISMGVCCQDDIALGHSKG